MGTTVAVDTDHLRRSAQALAEANDGLRDPVIHPHRLGSTLSAEALERFDGYWHSGRSALTGSIDALEHVLRATADVYVQRDDENAKAFAGAARAF